MRSEREYDAEVLRAAATARNGFEFDRMLQELEPLREQALPDEEQAYIADPLQSRIYELERVNRMLFGSMLIFAVVAIPAAVWFGWAVLAPWIMGRL